MSSGRKGPEEDGDQRRIFMWGTPRSCSSVFMRAMMNLSSCKVFLEPYLSAFYWGPDRGSKRYGADPINMDDTFESIRDKLEQPFPGSKTVFVKDIAFYLRNKMVKEVLPKNYRHTFIIRDPAKAVPSLYKLAVNKELTGWDYFDPSETGFKELYDMYEFISHQLKEDTIVIDADDLLEHPEATMRSFCKHVDISFEQKLLSWEKLPADNEVFADWVSWCQSVMDSTGFNPPSKRNPHDDLSSYPDAVRESVNADMMYYQKLYAKRLIL